ncbi:MAG: 6-carboxytetrahydropterin synthase QueD [Bacteroidetes bacterium GWF2_33_38]|nr:MAG: 6-carboxytetrahydropterin synthase QueD [Bacteroidetes bacterium GWF2_33_38]OFY90147.1 MAG: 6-carboxytetrahydropterin synthase QueD [Bacteroidetes bacterium RIFOXYA2_FULL_33_7]
MTKIRVTKEFGFESAHALWNYDGKCKNVHGHSYRLFVTVLGEPIENENDVKLGMVIDFGDLKKIVIENIVNRFDHTLFVNNKAEIKNILETDQMFERFETLNYQPTCENFVIHFAEILKQTLPKSVNLFSIRLYETPSSYAEWFAEDQR